MFLIYPLKVKNIHIQLLHSLRAASLDTPEITVKTLASGVPAMPARPCVFRLAPASPCVSAGGHRLAPARSSHRWDPLEYVWESLDNPVECAPIPEFHSPSPKLWARVSGSRNGGDNRCSGERKKL